MRGRVFEMPLSGTPDVSVTIIAYNDAERLPRAVESVCNQTLRNVEVIIADDCSTDDTEQVARALARKDPRVRYERLARNSGGCSAPRNRGIAVSRAPYLMFLDSDDALPRHACKSMLLAIEETGADFVTGEVERIYENSKRAPGLWYPHLFTTRATYDGIAENPEMFFDHLSTNKIYRRDFIEKHALRFPEGIHYEDQLFSAQAFTLAERFAVVPWVIYSWYLSDDTANLSISNSRHKMKNVADRLKVARMVDEFLADESVGHELRVAKDVKFLRHDFRLYLGDLPLRDPEWVDEFAALTRPYLNAISDDAYAQLPRDQRICLYLLRKGRNAEAVEQARVLGRGTLAPRFAVTDADRTYWGRTAPQDDEARTELDISDYYLDRQSFTSAVLRNEVESVEPRGSVLRLGIRVYDPGHALSGDSYNAHVNLASTGSPLRVPVVFKRSEPGQFTGTADLDLRRVPLPKIGFDGRRHPTLTITLGDQANTNLLLAPLDMAVHRVEIPHNRVGVHTLTVEAEPAPGPRRLQITWARGGLLKELRFLGPVQRKVKRKTKALRKQLNSHGNKAAAYRVLARLPVKKNQVIFEAAEGLGYRDNPRYIYEEAMRQQRPLDVVWSYSGNRASFPPGTRLVRRGSWKYVRTLARSEYWVDSHNLPSIYHRRPGTHYLQTWHGQTMKTIGFDIPEMKSAGPEALEHHQRMVDRWDLLVSPSKEFERTFVPANNYQGPVVRSGYPRNDVLVRHAEPEQVARRAAVRSQLDVPEGARVLLYAPTFRNRGISSIRVDLDELAAQAPPGWIIVVRAHYYDRFSPPRHLGHFVRNGADFSDVNDLLLASDALMTDYSSLMFDYANTGRPMIFYADDYEEYRNQERGTYYDLPEMAPGPVVGTTEELAGVLHDFDATVESYAARYAEFREMFCSYESGEASRAVVDAFFGEDKS
ncbi:bifunctional glycosyltransferase/CDP-glycerol:glycerophosphate glycerophosphotransferase [Uniformispora flossi]|uniref:bifunctional glycosyltransferase/CDP-glycerol:glycerophosphate glycerophosphotransferase n=1 Tax=Uniformispora flossi TaxID=3390723 RepID=UPI003C2C9717